jgi:malate/lactate dehydrogenase
MRKKVTVVGSGFVGSTTAQRIVDLELADVVLTDILDGPPAGKALDMVEPPRSRDQTRASREFPRHQGTTRKQPTAT